MKRTIEEEDKEIPNKKIKLFKEEDEKVYTIIIGNEEIKIFKSTLEEYGENFFRSAFSEKFENKDKVELDCCPKTMNQIFYYMKNKWFENIEEINVNVYNNLLDKFSLNALPRLIEIKFSLKSDCNLEIFSCSSIIRQNITMYSYKKRFELIESKISSKNVHCIKRIDKKLDIFSCILVEDTLFYETQKYEFIVKIDHILRVKKEIESE